MCLPFSVSVISQAQKIGDSIMSLSFRFLLSFILGASILILISGCGGGPEIPEFCQNQETFVGPQNQECYQ